MAAVSKMRTRDSISAGSAITTAPTTARQAAADDDWPCPDREACSYHRRPSWQAQEPLLQRDDALASLTQHPSASASASSAASTTHAASAHHHHRVHNPFALSLRLLPPRAPSPAASKAAAGAGNPSLSLSAAASSPPHPRHQPTTNKITFLSPFESSCSTLAAPAVEAPLSPFCLPASPFTDMESLAPSSPGLATPSSLASMQAGSPCCCCHPSSACLSSGTGPRSNMQHPPQPNGFPCDLCSTSSIASTSTHPYSFQQQQHLASSPPRRVQYATRSPSHQPASIGAHSDTTLHLQTVDNLQYRRRSVDVGMLNNARGHQRHGRTSQADAPAAAFVPPDQLKAHRARKSVNQRNKEFLFAQHLTTILRHSLSLCSIVAPDADIEAWSNAASPRSSISSTSSSGLVSISDRLVAPVQVHSSSVPRRLRLPSLPQVVPSRRLELIAMLSSWSFDANLLDLDELCECACILFECFLESDGLSKDAGTPSRWRTFLVSLRAAYHPQNAYHNFAHAVDVLQACYSFLSHLGVAPPLSILQQERETRKGAWKREEGLNEKGRIGDILRPMDVLALLVAAIGHDVGHPGLTNAYMINARTPAAQVYNDKSVLENFHSVTLIRMLKIHGFGSLLEDSSVTPSTQSHTPSSLSSTTSTVESGQGTDFRQVLLTSVLVTDMSRHFPFVEKLTHMGERLAKNDYISTEVREDRLVICSALMKCADISNPSRPHPVASFWSSALLEEWGVQAEIEAKFELPVSVVTLKSDERTAQAKSQVGFINLFTQPLFDKLATAVPSFQLFADYCKAGRTPWETILNEDEGMRSDKTPRKDSVASADSPQSALSRVISASPNGSYPSHIRIPEYRPAPHRLPWSARASEFPYDASIPSSPSNTTVFSTSPSTASSLLFKDDRSSPSSAATTFSSSSWIPSNAVEAYHPLVEEACTDYCSSITALCASCARRQAQDWNDEDATANTITESSQMGTTSSALVASGQWPPEPFRPTPQAKPSHK